MAIEQYWAQEYTFSYTHTTKKKKTQVEDKMEFIFARFYTRKCPLKSLQPELSLCSLLSSRPILGSFTLSPFLFLFFSFSYDRECPDQFFRISTIFPPHLAKDRPFIAGLRNSQVISFSRPNPKRLSSFTLMKTEFWVLSSPFVCFFFYKYI